MRRPVIDASVLVSAAVAHPDSRPTKLLGAVRAGEFEMLICKRLLGEVERALNGRYFTKRVAAEERIAYLALIRTLGVNQPDPQDPPPVLRDAADDYLVALAASSDADAIVTGDRDLLDHEGLRPPAITVREACRRLGIDGTPPTSS